MHLKNMTIGGFKSFSYNEPQKISFEKDRTVFIGNNGTGKSAILDALNKLFSVSNSFRTLSPSEFHVENEDDKTQIKNLFIDVTFGFSKIKDDVSIPSLIEQMTLDDGEDVIFRVRLEASLSYEFSDAGDIDESIYIITDISETPSDECKIKLSPLIRNSIQIHYVPATRDPLKQLTYSSSAILGKLMKAINWDENARDEYKEKASELIAIAKKNREISLISDSINSGWSTLYKESVLSNAQLDFPLNSIDDLMKLVTLFLSPNEQGAIISAELLSDGQRSLMYLAIINALFNVEIKIKHAAKGEYSFDKSKLRLPIFSLISLEEPENHLSPHYLGRIIKLFSNYAEKDSFQMVMSTHSTSIMSRIEPKQVRHFSLKNTCSVINKLKLPLKSDEKFKFINEAVKSYPEIYFASLVILVEGDSEQVILPKIFESYNFDADSKNIAIAPLGGRHVNHFWRLLESLKVPYITLLDLDLGRNGGGFERIKYAIKQLSSHRRVNYLHSEMLDQLPSWDSEQDPLTFTINYDDGKDVNIVDELKKHNIFFSAPLDIDYMMINSFPEIYCEIDSENNERGPGILKQEKLIEDDIIKQVLKEGNKGNKNYKHDNGYLIKFVWYNYRFLGSKSKPASHIRLINKIKGSLVERMPSVLQELVQKVGEISHGR
ncbi:ATP-dependent nuclease [Enterobacter hormaechei]|uniref:ATP-dependent nuclease n=1 Tax=Enterobacter hormaechei TaxID=158836 RepID=UPI00201FC93E|nr:AAA family ATPase [Enterobacter hormaechei]MCL8082517.1 AAA family ATPase [Enterobacter hormaechei]MCM8484855.1 AAA family ATPase [Enterobacter hormaechei]MDF3718591.1 AAA family ATPase [Enterobacter hormaechei]